MGGFLNIRDNYWPKAIGSDPALQIVGYVDAICTVIMMGPSHRQLQD